MENSSSRIAARYVGEVNGRGEGGGWRVMLHGLRGAVVGLFDMGF